MRKCKSHFSCFTKPQKLSRRILNPHIAICAQKGFAKHDQITTVRHLTGLDVSDFKIVAMADAFIHINHRHGKEGLADHSMSDLEDYGRVGYVINNLDSAVIVRSANGTTPEYARGYHDKNHNRVPVLLARKQIDGHFMISHIAPDTSRKAIFIVSAYTYKSKEVPELEANVANATLTTRHNATQNIGTSATIVSQNRDGEQGDRDPKHSTHNLQILGRGANCKSAAVTRCRN